MTKLKDLEKNSILNTIFSLVKGGRKGNKRRLVEFIENGERYYQDIDTNKIFAYFPPNSNIVLIIKEL